MCGRQVRFVLKRGSVSVSTRYGSRVHGERCACALHTVYVRGRGQRAHATLEDDAHA